MSFTTHPVIQLLYESLITSFTQQLEKQFSLRDRLWHFITRDNPAQTFLTGYKLDTENWQTQLKQELSAYEQPPQSFEQLKQQLVVFCRMLLSIARSMVDDNIQKRPFLRALENLSLNIDLIKKAIAFHEGGILLFQQLNTLIGKYNNITEIWRNNQKTHAITLAYENLQILKNSSSKDQNEFCLAKEIFNNAVSLAKVFYPNLHIQEYISLTEGINGIVKKINSQEINLLYAELSALLNNTINENQKFDLVQLETIVKKLESFPINYNFIAAVNMLNATEEALTTKPETELGSKIPELELPSKPRPHEPKFNIAGSSGVVLPTTKESRQQDPFTKMATKKGSLLLLLAA